MSNVILREPVAIHTAYGFIRAPWKWREAIVMENTRRLTLLRGIGSVRLSEMSTRAQPQEEARAAWVSVTQGMRGQDALIVLASPLTEPECRRTRSIFLENIVGMIVVHWEDNQFSTPVQTVVTVDPSKETVVHLLTANYRRMFANGADCFNRTLRTFAGFCEDVSTYDAGRTMLDFYGQPDCWFDEVAVRPPAQGYGQSRPVDEVYPTTRVDPSTS